MDLCLQQGAMKAAAEKNGMTIEQIYAGRYVQRIGKHLPAEAKAVLANRETALPALDRIAALPMGDCHIDLQKRIIAAILA